MVFKLIRVDTEDTSKVQLQVGKHVIGRGNFLQIDNADRRVSKTHAELEVTDNLVILKALHQNPCFYIKSSTVDTEILQQNNAINLSNGDKFGLLPDNFWYEVIQCSEPDIHENATACIDRLQNEMGGNIKENENRDQSEIISKMVNSEEPVNFHINEEPDNLGSRSPSPSLLDPSEATQEYVPPAEAKLNSPNKRPLEAHTVSPLDIKRLKPDPDAQDAGPSNYQAVQNPDSTDQKPNIVAPAAPPQPPAPQRERCIYGANCYRRNPQHKAQFSHPADGDWGAGERGVCPRGGACRKRDPRHWAAHLHPPGTLPPADFGPTPGQGRDRNRNNNGDSSRVNRKSKRIAKSSGSEDESEDSPETDLIVTGKRVRKNVKRGTWIDTQSDEDEDPYGTDESDEWQPSSDITNSEGFSQNF